MPPHNPDTGTVFRFDTHRPVVSLPDDWCAEHLQIEQAELRLYTADELLFAMFLAGVVGSLITCASAWLIVAFVL